MNNQQLSLIKPILEKHGVAFAGVFGSRARGDERPDSDLDLLVRFKEAPGFFSFVGLEQELSRVLGHKVDLVTANSLSRYFRDEVLKQLTPIYGN